MSAPETRGWIAIGSFALTVYVFSLIAFRPDLADNTLFVTLATAVVVGSWGAVVNFYYAASKGATEANARADKALDVASNAQEAKK